MGLSLPSIVAALGRFYSFLIIGYVLLSWFPDNGGFIYDVKRVLGSIVEPYLSLFRRFIPPLGGIDFSPIIALIVWNLLVNLLVSVTLRI